MKKRISKRVYLWFTPRNFVVGVYWNKLAQILYIHPLPMLSIAIELGDRITL